LASEITLVRSVLVANEYDITIVFYYSVDITAYAMVHILPLCDNVLTALGNDYHIIAIGKLKGGFVLFIVGSQTLIVILCLFTLVGCFGFAILSHKVIDLLGSGFHNTTVFKVANKIANATLILPHFTSYKVVDSNGQFLCGNRGHFVDKAVIHILCHLFRHTAEGFLGVLIVEPLAEMRVVKIVKPSLVAIGVKLLDVFANVDIALKVAPKFSNAKSINFLRTTQCFHIARIGGGVGVVANHRAKQRAEIGVGIIAIVIQSVNHSGLFGAGLDRISLDTIEDTRVEVKAILAIYSVNVEDNDVAFFAIGRHSS
jgi:hypothetical protein